MVRASREICERRLNIGACLYALSAIALLRLGGVWQKPNGSGLEKLPLQSPRSPHPTTAPLQVQDFDPRYHRQSSSWLAAQAYAQAQAQA